MARLGTLWDEITDSLWFVPALITAGCVGLAILLISYNDAISGVLDSDLWFIFAGSGDGAQGVLQAIATSIITVTGVVFSVTIVALQLASSQFTPRVLRQFMANRGNQIVLGVFIGTFTYTLLVLRTIRGDSNGDEFVPNIAVTGAVLLALTSIGFLIFFINHAARAVQASVIIDTVWHDTRAAIDAVFPERVEHAQERVPDAAALSVGDPAEYAVVRSLKSGYVQAIDRSGLCRIAELHQLVIRTEFEIGEHVLPGQALFSVWPGADLRDDRHGELRGNVVLGMERTQYQDVKFGMVEMMDIAVKAMSPSINDPTTAVNVIDRVSDLMLELAWRRRGDHVDRSREGRPLLIMRRPRLADTADIVFHQVRHYSAENPTIAIKLVQSLAELEVLAPADARSVFRTHLDHVVATAGSKIDDEGDHERLRAATATALGRIAAARDGGDGGELAEREFGLDHERSPVGR
jgi:uncharacterized membrane protein